MAEVTRLLEEVTRNLPSLKTQPVSARDAAQLSRCFRLLVSVAAKEALPATTASSRQAKPNATMEGAAMRSRNDSSHFGLEPFYYCIPHVRNISHRVHDRILPSLHVRGRYALGVAIGVPNHPSKRIGNECSKLAPMGSGSSAREVLITNCTTEMVMATRHLSTE